MMFQPLLHVLALVPCTAQLPVPAFVLTHHPTLCLASHFLPLPSWMSSPGVRSPKHCKKLHDGEELELEPPSDSDDICVRLRVYLALPRFKAWPAGGPKKHVTRTGPT